MNQFFTGTDYFALVPAVMLALFGCAILLFDFMCLSRSAAAQVAAGLRAAGGEGFAGVVACGTSRRIWRLDWRALSAFQGSLTMDGFCIFFNWIFIAAAVIVAMVSYKYLEIAGEHHGEYYC